MIVTDTGLPRILGTEIPTQVKLWKALKHGLNHLDTVEVKFSVMIHLMGK